MSSSILYEGRKIKILCNYAKETINYLLISKKHIYIHQI